MVMSNVINALYYYDVAIILMNIVSFASFNVPRGDRVWQNIYFLLVPTSLRTELDVIQ